MYANKVLMDQHQGILARFFESFHKIDLALEIWKSGGDTINCHEACNETVRILKMNPDKAR